MTKLTESKVEIIEKTYTNGMVCRRVSVNGELFYEECYSGKSLNRKSNSKLEAFLDWLAGNEKTESIEVSRQLADSINIEYLSDEIAKTIIKSFAGSKSIQAET